MPTVSTENSHHIIHVMQRYTIFRGITYIIFASLWLYYMQALIHPHSAEIDCHDVCPTMRTVLLIMAWVKLIVIVLFVCFVLTNLLLQPSIEQLVFVLAMLVIMGIFLYQIQFLNAIERSTAKAGECDKVETHKRRMIYAFTMVIFVVGVLLITFGVTGGSLIQRFVSSSATNARAMSKGATK